MHTLSVTVVGCISYMDDLFWSLIGTIVAWLFRIAPFN